MNEKKCPVCNSPMYYNGEGLAKNPKAPTHKCSNQDCKFQFDRKTNQWVPGKFRTSIWEESNQFNQTPGQPATPPVQANIQNDAKPNLEEINAKKENGMKALNAINNACLLVANGKAELKDIQELTNKIFSLQPVRFKAPLAPVNPAIEQVPVESTPVQEEEIKIENVPF